MDKKWLETYAEKFKVLGHPVRLQIVIGLLNNECNVSKICEGLKIPQATTSQHLIALKNKGILDCKREGTTVCYYVVDEDVKAIVEKLIEVTGVDPSCK
ncbi:winged helix-turn-helix transcriptional regulator [Deferribacter autotrophicus]|uniref:Winged helix-turn-helix transcriptional regulator n=1 Tax=Deferribacter autotrophicus TaxID=500465 RepID=A0A5A8F563_9BACT|nr:metalloregulator ArsR/SmtB family transcription factor [Deferribacter autotrophicus]KAA0258636.1 winged helix-turn-helix transcriptional regulator [Deferribacter autotrophicus]